MSKKKNLKHRVVMKNVAPPKTAEQPAATAPESTLVSAEPATPLIAEVHSFLSKRDELAKKLSEEIAATEAKLIELRKTAAALFPEKAGTAIAASKDKKAKKLLKAKPLSGKAAAAAASGAISADDAPAEETSAAAAIETTPVN
jgi:hypothetical protein